MWFSGAQPVKARLVKTDIKGADFNTDLSIDLPVTIVIIKKYAPKFKGKTGKLFLTHFPV
tara:strand:+ start:130 stop:309 length:180 start_codon:yes stop_codon:yes gene_type:complete